MLPRSRRKSDVLKIFRKTMVNDVHCAKGHDVNETRSTLIERMQHQRVSPRNNSKTQRSKRQGKACLIEVNSIWKYPNEKETEQVSKITKIRQKIVIVGFIIRVESYGHEETEHSCIIDMKPFRKLTHKKPNEKNVDDCKGVK